jgi:endonuclease G
MVTDPIYLFYKVVLRYSKNNATGIGFLFENKGFKASLSDCALSIDSVEKVTGIDFYPALNDKEEQQIESQVDKTKWKWKQGSK